MFSAKYLSVVALVAATAVQAAPGRSSAPVWPSTLSSFSERVAAHAVSYCANPNDCTTQTVIDNVCSEVGTQMNNRMSSFQSPSQGVICKVFSEAECGGQSYTIPATGARNLGKKGFPGNGSKGGITNLMCTGSAVSSNQIALAHTVSYCKGAYAKMGCQQQIAADGMCTEVPVGYSGDIHSFRTPDGVTCTLFDGILCQGNQYTIDASNNPDFDVHGSSATTFRCTKD